MFNKEKKVALRKKEFKKTFDPEEAKQKREQQAFSIRKSKRDENLQKRRNMGAIGTPAIGSEEALQQVRSYLSIYLLDISKISIYLSITISSLSPPLSHINFLHLMLCWQCSMYGVIWST